MKGPSEETLDISSLLYDLSSTWSQLSYFLLLMSSVSSVCMDLAKILKWGHNPIITSYVSFTFCKIFLFILTKFLVQSYCLSMAIKSIMFYSALTFDSEKNSNIFNNLLQYYYKGVNNEPQVLTFDQATLYAPLIILTLLFLPSIIFAFVCSIWNTGCGSWSENFVKNMVLFLFAVMSNMSYFSSPLNNKKGKKTEREIETGTEANEESQRRMHHLEVIEIVRSTPPMTKKHCKEISRNVQESGNCKLKYTDHLKDLRKEHIRKAKIETKESILHTPTIIDFEDPEVKEDRKLLGL